MANKITAVDLAAGGWDDAQIEKYYRLLDRKNKFGLTALTTNERKFYLTAQPTVDKVVRHREAARIEAAKKGGVENSKHYRFQLAGLQTLKPFLHTNPNEVSAQTIIREEHLRALRQLSPTLNMYDCPHREKIFSLIPGWLELARSLKNAREFHFDTGAALQAMKEKMGEEWNEKWDDCFEGEGHREVFFHCDEELDFRAIVRKETETAMVKVFPSIRRR